MKPLFGLFFLFSIFCQAQSLQSSIDQINNHCEEVDHREKLGPVRDQKDIGWCYAFAAADLATFETGRRISATDLAIGQMSDKFNTELKDQRPQTGIGGYFNIRHIVRSLTSKRPATALTDMQEQGGGTYQSLENRTKKGFCLEEQLPSFGSSLSQGVGSYFKEVEEIADRNAKSFCPNDREIAKVQIGFPEINKDDLQSISHRLYKSSALEELADKSCRDRVPPNPNSSLDVYGYSVEEMANGANIKKSISS